MIDADDFLNGLSRRGYTAVSGVPCSYLTPLINAAIESTSMRYLNAANEGEAVAVAAGVALGGGRAVAMFQNSGLGNAVSPLTSLTWTFRLPVLLIVTWRGMPGGPADEPQHELMGRMMREQLSLMEIPTLDFPAHERDVEATMQQADHWLSRTNRPVALVMRKGDVAARPLTDASKRHATARIIHEDAARSAAEAGMDDRFDPDVVIASIRDAASSEDILVATTGFTGRTLYAAGDADNQLYMVGSMGCLSSLALGLATSQPERRIIAIDGDGSLLMRAGALSMAAAARPQNLLHIVLDNGVHDSTGAQSTLSHAVDLPALARASGYADARWVEPSSLSTAIADGLGAPNREAIGPNLLVIRTRPRIDRKLPRPGITPADIARRLQTTMQVQTLRPTDETVDHKVCLLNPGPVTLSPRVREASKAPDMCHREPRYSELMSEVRDEIANVYADQSRGDADPLQSVLIGGSGTAAVESMVQSFVADDRTALVCINGVYGKRIENMLRAAGKSVATVESTWEAPLDIDAIDRRLAQDKSIEHVITVQHETTTGRLNDIDALSRCVAAHDRRLLLDGVSSFGATKIDFVNWPLDAVALTANKCLHGIPGVAAVVSPTSSLENAQHAKSVYFDLNLNRNAQDNGYPAFTPPIPAVHALRAALAELNDDGGWTARARQYSVATGHVVSAAARLGIERLLGEGRSDILTSFRLPSSITFETLDQSLRSEAFVIYAGQKHLYDSIFRVSVMGCLDDRDWRRFAAALHRAIAPSA